MSLEISIQASLHGKRTARSFEPGWFTENLKGMMKAHRVYVIFVFLLSLALGLVDADGNIQRVGAGKRPHPEPISSELVLFPTRPDLGDDGVYAPGPYKYKLICAMNTSADLRFTKPPIASKLQKLYERSSDSQYIKFNHCDAGFKVMFSLIQTLAACFRHIAIGLAGLVSATIHLRAGLFKVALPIFLTHSDDFRFSHHDRAFKAGIMPYQHNMTLWGSEKKCNRQSIVIMEEDPVVIQSATYLFERNPTVSTLLMYQKGVLHTLRGIPYHLTRNHCVILVGHGSKGSNGVAQLAGYGPEELARAVSAIKTENSYLHTISLISCNLGNNLHFVRQLLQALRSFNVETKLHLHNSFLSVSPDGEIMTKDNGVWRHHDHSSRVFAELDSSGDLLTTVELGRRGQVFPDYQGDDLYFQTLEWPGQPQMFVPEQLRKKYTSIDCLEGLTWSLFFEENERRRAPDYVPEQLKAIWLTEPWTKAENIVFKHITNILDLLVEIRYNAREEAVSDLYYVLNDCIYKVQRTNFNVTFVGKFMDPNNRVEVEDFLNSFNDQKDLSSLQELRQGLKAFKFSNFCRQTFQLRQCTYNCERWGHYFMAAVFSASVRNFRTFSLFLMSIIACEVGRLQGTDSSLCTAFAGDDHPMATDDPWPGPPRRGFYGCTVDNLEMAKQERLVWLDQVVAKENALYIKSKQMMNDVDHDQQTELDIFGKVKVMNKYVFSSYLEFFRGTPEGKKLKRGCITSPQENSNS